MEILKLEKLKMVTRTKYWTLFKWSIMVAVIFWMVVFRLSEQGVKVPEFIYVNF